MNQLEGQIAKAEDLTFSHDSWRVPFIADWLKLSPPLADIDLRPLLYLSRDKAISIASFDELSPGGRELLTALCKARLFAEFNGKEISYYCAVRLSYPVSHSKRGFLFDSFRSFETLGQSPLTTGFCCLSLPT